MMKGIGYFLGLTIVAALLFYFISIIFLQPRKVNVLEIEKFMDNSEFIKIVTVPYVGRILSNDDEKLGININSKMTYFSNRNMSYVRAETYTYYCAELKKYVSTYVIVEGAGLNSDFIEFGEETKDSTIWPDIQAYYNKNQNNDPTFGTLEKPLPILFFKSSNPTIRSMRPNNKDSDSAYLKQVYEETVKLYLEYFIEKEDFKKLFPDS